MVDSHHLHKRRNMPRNRSSKGKKPLGEVLGCTQNLQVVKCEDNNSREMKYQLSNQSVAKPSSSLNDATSLSSNAAALHGELDLFRQRWKRELETKKTISDNSSALNSTFKKQTSRKDSNCGMPQTEDITDENKVHYATLKESFTALNDPPRDPKDVYNLAKRLFLIGVDLERDELHNESIRYYKQAMHLCPNIERQIFREQLAATAATSNDNKSSSQTEDDDPKLKSKDEKKDTSENYTPLLDRIRANHIEKLNDDKFTLCKPARKLKPDTLHISDLPHELILKICRHIIGQDLDLASLEQFGMVCRGLYLVSNDSSLWRSTCYRTWGTESFGDQNKTGKQIDWRQVYIEKPRVNCDGVYISRTRYIRQGDVGFQDITYRPFHLIRYYRYMRFFLDKRVLILTTNEEPDKIIPIFRHAMDSKHFSSELSVLEGTYEFVEPSQVIVVADKEFYPDQAQPINASARHVESRRQARFHWSRQTPLNQRFSMKFELKTLENRPFKNNVLKWCEYTISSKFETGTEVTTFDLSPDTFPNLAFSRVKRFNQRSVEPLTSH